MHNSLVQPQTLDPRPEKRFLPNTINCHVIGGQRELTKQLRKKGNEMV